MEALISGRKTIHALQVFRGVAALLVVFYHATQFLVVHYQVAPLYGVFLFGFSGVHLFFVLSGFIILTIHHDDIGKPRQLWSYCKKRFVRIYPTYWATLAIVSTWALSKGLTTGPDIMRNLGLVTRPASYINPVCWTLSFEMMFYIIFSVLIIHRRAGLVLLVCWASGVLVNYVNPIRVDWVSPILFHHFTVLFMIGLVAAYATIRSKSLDPKRRHRLAGVAGLAGVVLFSSVAVYCLANKILDWGTWRFTIGFGLASGLLMACSLVEPLEKFFEKRRILRSLGNASYSIYLLHYLLVMILTAWARDHIHASGQLRVSLVFIAVCSVTILVGWFFYWCIERPMVRAIRGWFVGKAG